MRYPPELLVSLLPGGTRRVLDSTLCGTSLGQVNMLRQTACTAIHRSFPSPHDHMREGDDAGRPLAYSATTSIKIGTRWKGGCEA
jgi:hypothetical protein